MHYFLIFVYKIDVNTTIIDLTDVLTIQNYYFIKYFIKHIIYFNFKYFGLILSKNCISFSSSVLNTVISTSIQLSASNLFENEIKFLINSFDIFS